MTRKLATDGGGIERRDALKLVGGSAIALALAGCSELIESDDDALGDAEVPDADIEAGLQTYTEGAAAVLGVQAEYGAETAVRRINENGGVAGRNINLEVVNEDGTWLPNLEQFYANEKDVTFGPISSGGHEAMVPEINAEEVVNVSTDGTVSTLYEDVDGGHPPADNTYSFRFQNHDVMEALSAAFEAVEVLGADGIETYAGINPGYAFGEDEHEIFSTGIEQLTGAEEVYSGFPDLGTDDMSTHVSSVNSAEPDVLFTSCWGGDATLLLEQSHAANLFDNVELVVGPVLYGSANDFSEDLVAGPIHTGSRNFYWDEPSTGRWTPASDLLDEVQDEYGVVPTAHFMSGYGAVTAWATAVEKAIRILGEWPSQDAIAEALVNHGFHTPAGYHTMGPDHQCYSNAHFGELAWSNDLDAATIEDVNVFTAEDVSAPQGTPSLEWIEGW